MARPPRLEIPGGIFHVYARGAARSALFRGRADRLLYLALLKRTIQRCGWLCLAYCLMGNHVHLLLETPFANLGRGMQSLHGRYAQRFNQRHDRKGHLFESRYGSVHVENDAQLWMTIRYLALNPVEAGLVARADDYEWSSYGRVVTGRPPGFLATQQLLAYLAAGGGDPLEQYQELVVADF